MKRFIAAVGATCLLAVAINAQQQSPSGNAALRYWMAFAMLQDAPANAATTDLLQRVVDGSAPWDEDRLAPIIRANAAALAIMERASTLQSCDWGIEYELGPRAPIAHLARARVLGRLGVLSGIRFAALGQTSEAVDRWLATIRFSQHLAQDGTLISLLSANSVLLPSLRRLADEASRLTPESRTRIATGLRALPETGFDWPNAMVQEERALIAGVGMNAIPNLRSQDLDTLHTTVAQIADALRLPPDRARAALANVKLASLPFPSPLKVNEQREVIRAARQKVLDAVAR